MSRSRNTLNNLMMENCRRDSIYRTIITDLVITGNISKKDGAMLLGYDVPSYLHTPDGKTVDNIADEDDIATDEDDIITDDDEDNTTAQSILENGLNDIRG